MLMLMEIAISITLWIYVILLRRRLLLSRLHHPTLLPLFQWMGYASKYHVIVEHLFIQKVYALSLFSHTAGGSWHWVIPDPGIISICHKENQDGIIFSKVVFTFFLFEFANWMMCIYMCRRVPRIESHECFDRHHLKSVVMIAMSFTLPFMSSVWLSCIALD